MSVFVSRVRCSISMWGGYSTCCLNKLVDYAPGLATREVRRGWFVVFTSFVSFFASVTSSLSRRLTHENAPKRERDAAAEATFFTETVKK